MAKRDKYRNKKLSDFFDYTEGKMSDKERNAFERRMQKDPFASDAADGFSGVSREEAEQDLQLAAERIRMRVEGESSRNSIGRSSSRSSDNESRTVGDGRISGNRNSNRKQRISRSRRIAWYSAAAAIASLMIVSTIFFRLNDNGLERFETAPGMREATRGLQFPMQEDEVEPETVVEPKTEVEPETLVEQQLADQQEEMVQDRSVRDDATFPVTAGPDAKKGYDLKEMQIHEKRQSPDQEENNLAKGAPAVAEDRQVVDEDRQAVEEDHAFAWEKMEKEAAAGRYNATRQRITSPEAPTEPKMAYDQQAPMAAIDNVKRHQTVADISYRPTGTVSGVVRSADDLEPLPGAVVKLKDSETGTVADLEGRFVLETMTDDEETLEVSYIGMKPETVLATTDQPMEIALVPDEISLDEVVVIGHGNSKKSNMTAATVVKETDTGSVEYKGTVTESGSVEYESAAPEKGMTDFRSYIDSTLVYPELTETSKKEVVVLKFSVSPDGRPQNFRVIRAPDDEAFEKEAIRVVSDGPAWQPATKNGQHTEEEVRLRIVFRKD